MKFSTVLLIFFVLNIYAQDSKHYNIYFDENNQPIEITDYYKKCSAFLYHCMNKTKDSITINYMYESNKFGQLDSIENIQIRKLLKRDIKNKDIDNQPIIIVFRDTLYGFDQLQKRYDSYVERLTINDSLREIAPFRLTKNRYISARKKYDSNQKKCAKKYKNENYNVLYFYRYNMGYSYNAKNFKWSHVNASLNHLFFKQRYSTAIILKPNGQYFIYKEMTDKFIKKMLNEDWTPYINQYHNAALNLQNKRSGFFKDMLPQRPNNMVFYTINSSPSGSGYRNNTTVLKSNRIPSNAIQVKNRGEISRYLDIELPCYSAISY